MRTTPRKLKPREESKVAQKRADFRSVGFRDSFYRRLRSYCAERDMLIADFAEAACEYCMAHEMKVIVSKTVDLGNLPETVKANALLKGDKN